MASFHHQIKSGKKGSAATHAAYIARQGQYSRREDLVYSEYGNMPAWAMENQLLFWQAADQNERKNGAAYREHEIALPKELTREQQVELARELAKAIAKERPHLIAIHSPKSSLAGEDNTHLHLMCSDRIDDGIQRSIEQTFRRYNAAHPERGGWKKASGGKNRLELRDEVIETRRKSAEIQNAALARYGHEIRVDHRTLREQGIERCPEQHLGQYRIRTMPKETKEEIVHARKNRDK